MRLLLPALLILLPSLAGAQAADAPDAELDGILKRLESRDPFTVFHAEKDLRAWAIFAGRKAKPALEALKGRGTERRQGTVTTARELLGFLGADSPEIVERTRREAAELESKRQAEAKEEGLRAAEDAAAREPDQKRILKLLRTVAGPHPFDRVPEMDELEDWARSAPGEFRALVKPYLGHRDVELAAFARHLESLVAEAEGCEKFLSALEPGLRSVAGIRRNILWRDAGSGIAEGQSPDDNTPIYGWEVLDPDEWRPDRMRHDGPVTERRSGYPRAESDREIRAWLGDRASFTLLPADEQFWRAALFTRWACDMRLGTSALACWRIAKQIAHDAWPTEDDAALGTRVLRHAQLILVHAASMCTRRPYQELELWGRVAAMPREFWPTDHDAVLDRVQQFAKGSERWQGRHFVDRLPPAEQVEVALWRALTWNSDTVSSGRVGAVLEMMRSGSPSFDEPAVCLRSLGWDAVPLLIEHLDDSTVTSTFDGDYRVKVGDVAWLALRSFAGLPNPEGIPADDLWHLRSSDGRALRTAFQEWWKRLGPLPEEDRWAALRKDGSATATTWLLEHAPERCLPDAWTRFDPDTRAGQLGRRAVLKSLSLAPRTRLEAIRDNSDGELHDAVVDLLNADAPPAK